MNTNFWFKLSHRIVKSRNQYGTQPGWFCLLFLKTMVSKLAPSFCQNWPNWTVNISTFDPSLLFFIINFFIANALYANTNSPETMEDFERSVYGDPVDGQSANTFFQKLDQPKKGFERYAMRKSGYVDGLDESFTSLTDGMDGKLKDAATYFKYDVNEVERDDYKYRPDVTFWPGNTYDVKDLDLTKPGVRKQAKRSEFEVTTEEVLQKADFRNVKFLANFITEAGVIIKRSKTKISAKAQRKVAREIKTARAFGLMPFTTMGTKHFAYGRSMQDLDKDYEYEVYDHNFVDDAS